MAEAWSRVRARRPLVIAPPLLATKERAAGPADVRRQPLERIYYLDWLRVLALFGVFLYHAVHPFDTMDWHLKNAEQTDVITGVLVFFLPWGLGLFFLLAGSGAFFSLRSRSARGYGSERVSRLLVPLVVAWILLSPVQGFIEGRHEGWLDGSFIGFIPRFFDEAAQWAVSWPGRPHPMIVAWNYHFWFLLMLLWFAFLGLPIFLWLRGPQGRRLSAWLAERSSWRGSSLLFGVPIALAHVALKARFPGEHDWGDFAWFFAFFVIGYVLASDPRFLAAVRRDLVPAIVVGVVGFAALGALDPFTWTEEWEAHPAYTPTYFLLIGLLSLQGWAWAVAALSVGMRVLRFRKPLPGAVADSAMPFFLVHQPLILTLAFFVVGWDAGIPVKLPVLLVMSFAASALAAWALSRTAVTRRLLGVKARAGPSAPQPMWRDEGPKPVAESRPVWTRAWNEGSS
ncbi:MAG: acyltransferase family protein [Actinomycetota bacterium]